LDDEALRTLHILNEVSKNNQLTQRVLSERLGVALGCTNLYLKRLIKKGLIKVKGIPGKRYLYYLTPNGFSEKTALSFRYIQFSWKNFKELRQQWLGVFEDLQIYGVRRVVLCGTDGMSELAFLSIGETDLEVVGVVDEERVGKNFCGHKIEPFSWVCRNKFDRIILIPNPIELGKVQNHREALISNGVGEEEMVFLNPGEHSLRKEKSNKAWIYSNGS